MKCKILVVFIAVLLICGLFFQAEAGKKKLIKKGLKGNVDLLVLDDFLDVVLDVVWMLFKLLTKNSFLAALIASAFKPTKAIIPIPLPIPVHIPIHTSWGPPSWPSW